MIDGYESPINMFVKKTADNISEELDNAITAKIIEEIGLDINKEELLKALAYDRDQYNRGYINGEIAGYKRVTEPVQISCKIEMSEEDAAKLYAQLLIVKRRLTMAKVIIKANMFMKPKELNDLYKFIYDQYKERDIILVPNYCDVYVVDGDSELKVEKTTEFKDIVFDQMKKGDMDSIKKAFELREDGKSLDEIAEELGYKEGEK